MRQEDRALLNGLYAPLEQRRREIQSVLAGLFPVSTGWFNGHYRRDEHGEYAMDSFPIPEISVTGVCDVELHFDMTAVTAKLSRDKALRCTFEHWTGTSFEAYGVEDYLLDFYKDGMSVEEMRENIRKSGEEEVFFTFSFDVAVEAGSIAAFVQQLIDNGFYD
ncbi:MAG: hypothetical protein IJ438_09655 [Clostridia bacterium]|nr:hypothetical protein [Clostridia bacterium]